MCFTFFTGSGPFDGWFEEVPGRPGRHRLKQSIVDNATWSSNTPEHLSKEMRDVCLRYGIPRKHTEASVPEENKVA